MLEALLKQAVQDKAIYIVLLGPFIDESNEHFSKGIIRVDEDLLTFSEYFDMMLELCEDEWLQREQRLVMVPSPRDLMTLGFAPQTPYQWSTATTSAKTKIELVPNPCSFKILQDLNMLVCNFSVIDDLMENSIFRSN